MWLMLVLITAQTGVDAGPSQAVCNGASVTLTASPIDPPANYSIQWDNAVEPGVFLVVSPSQSTPYRVTLTDLDTMTVYEDTAWVQVHPGDPDLVSDGQLNGQDILAFIDAWGGALPNPHFDPDGDGRQTVLDFAYFCDHAAHPPNTPPRLTVDNVITVQNQGIAVPYTIDDDEQTPTLQIASPPANGNVFLLSGTLQYIPNVDYVGADSFQLNVTDGLLTTPNITVQVTVAQPDDWHDLNNDIFVIYCKACHIDATSGGLSLSSFAAAQAGGVSGAGFVAGFPELSPLYLRVADGSMPFGQAPLSQNQLDRIYNWILRGAPQN